MDTNDPSTGSETGIIQGKQGWFAQGYYLGPGYGHSNEWVIRYAPGPEVPGIEIYHFAVCFTPEDAKQILEMVDTLDQKPAGYLFKLKENGGSF